MEYREYKCKKCGYVIKRQRKRVIIQQTEKKASAARAEACTQ